MLRNATLGAAVFGVLGTAAAYIWTAFEFPFAIVVPAMVGWFAVILGAYGMRKAVVGGLVGGISFTVALMVAFAFALTDGSPLALTPAASAIAAATIAGALTGLVLGGVKPGLAVAAFSAMGMAVAVLVAGLLRSVAPSAVDVEGAVQYAYFALSMGAVALVVGAAAGAAVAWVKARGWDHAASDGVGQVRPHVL